MTPPRLNELSCPNCKQASWTIDSDYRGMDGIMLPYEQRVYSCRHCPRLDAHAAVAARVPAPAARHVPDDSRRFRPLGSDPEGQFPGSSPSGRSRKKLRPSCSKRSVCEAVEQDDRPMMPLSVKRRRTSGWSGPLKSAAAQPQTVRRIAANGQIPGHLVRWGCTRRIGPLPFRTVRSVRLHHGPHRRHYDDRLPSVCARSR